MYETQPGTIAHRVVQFLRSQPEGAEMASVEIADALDVDQKAIVASLKTAIYHGVLRKRKVPGEMAHRLSLGDGRALPLPEDHERDEPLNPSASAPRPGALFPGVVGVAGSEPPEPEPEPAHTEKPLSLEGYVAAIDPDEQPAVGMPFNACRYVDGSLIVVGVAVREDGAIVFTPKQARDLWKLGAAA